MQYVFHLDSIGMQKNHQKIATPGVVELLMYTFWYIFFIFLRMYIITVLALELLKKVTDY